MKKIFILFLLFVAQLSFAQQDLKTKFEKSGFVSTDNYNSTIEYFNKIASLSEYAEMHEFGISPQGRRLYYLVIDKDKQFDPDANLEERDKPVILIQNGIHAGEIEGKDACMLLMREMLIDKSLLNLIDKVKIIIVPVFNVDGHERISPYNRINQNGPKEMGWRTTAQNFNLNRDYVKAVTPEMKALLRLFNKFNPDIYIDTHTTDGADYQYTITYGIDTHIMRYNPLKNFINKSLRPDIEKFVNDSGFLIAPYVSYVKGDYRNGIRDWISTPRFSHGYAALRNKIGILIETHMLKSYKDRVFSTKSFLQGIIKFANENANEITKLTKNAETTMSSAFQNKYYPIKLKITDKYDDFIYKGKESYWDSSFIAGTPIKKYRDKNIEEKVPYYHYSTVVDSIEVPKAYVIPKEYGYLTELLKLQDIDYLICKERKEIHAVTTKFSDVKFLSFPYEGCFSPSYKYEDKHVTKTINPGDVIVKTNQKNIGLIVYMFEPKSNDSLLKWGFFNPIFEQKEYFEAYSMEPIARKMYEQNPELREEFEHLLQSDSTFASNPRARLNFFYERSPYFDKKLNVYPVLKVID